MELKSNERLDYVNDDIELIQNTDGLTFGTDALRYSADASPAWRCGASKR
jgi:hypothetical protein